MPGTVPVARSALSLQDLLAQAWILEIRQRVDWQGRVVRLAAQMALEDAIPVNVEDWIGDCRQGRVIWIDPASGDPIPYLVSPFPAEVGERARAAGQEQLETIRRVAEGKLSLVGWENGEEDMSWRGHVDFWAIALKYERATEAVMSEMPPDWSKKTPWDVIADQIIFEAQIPGLTVEALAAYSNTLACDEPTGTTEVSAEVARLNASGLGEQLQAKLVERFGDELPAELLASVEEPSSGTEPRSPDANETEWQILDVLIDSPILTNGKPKKMTGEIVAACISNRFGEEFGGFNSNLKTTLSGLRKQGLVNCGQGRGSPGYTITDAGRTAHAASDHRRPPK